MLTAFQRSQAPQCGGSAASTPVATYQAPTNLATPSNCIDPASGLPYFTPECVEANLRIEAANQAKLDAANRAVFVQNCQNAWELNRQQYEALGLPVPPNDCAYRSYGQVAPGTTGGSTAYIANTPQAVIDWRTANPSGGVMNAWDPGSAETLKEFNAPDAAPSPVVNQAPPQGSAPTGGASAPKGSAPSGGAAPGGGSPAKQLPGGGAAGGGPVTETGGESLTDWLKKPVVIVSGAALIGFLIWQANR